jgi:hypothetical protein
MNDGKKTTGGAGKISQEGKAHTTRNGKVVQIRPKAGERGKQKRDRFAQKVIRGIEKKEALEQIEIPFPEVGAQVIGYAGTDGIGECGEGKG